MKKRQHPYVIFLYIKKTLIWMVFPVIRDLILNIHSEKANIFNSLSSFFGILMFAYLKYRFYKYEILDNGISINKGIIIKSNIFVPFKSINSITIKKDLRETLFKSASVEVSFFAKRALKSRLRLVVGSEDLKLYINKILNTICKKEILKKDERVEGQFFKPKEHLVNNFCLEKVYKNSNLKIFLVAAILSNPLNSLIIAIPFIKSVEKIVGESIKKNIYRFSDFRGQLILIGLSPFFATIIYVFIICFVVSVMVQFFKFFKLEVYKNKDFILIKRGFLKLNEKIIPIDKISMVKSKKSSLMAPFRVQNLYMYTKEKRRRERHNLILFLLNEKRLKILLKKFLPRTFL